MRLTHHPDVCYVGYTTQLPGVQVRLLKHLAMLSLMSVVHPAAHGT
jgi:hypothetical protein